MTKSWVRRWAVLAFTALSSSAWSFGDKPLQLIVPAPPGGTMDIVARLVGQQLAIDIGHRCGAEGQPRARSTTR